MTLSRTQFLYVAAVTMVVLPILVTLVVSPPNFSWWCELVQIHEYEKPFGFRTETFRVFLNERRQFSALGMGSIEPGGRFDRAGIRAGDIPINKCSLCANFCDVLAASSYGSVTFSVYNIDDSGARAISLGPSDHELRERD